MQTAACPQCRLRPSGPCAGSEAFPVMWLLFNSLLEGELSSNSSGSLNSNQGAVAHSAFIPVAHQSSERGTGGFLVPPKALEVLSGGDSGSLMNSRLQLHSAMVKDQIIQPGVLCLLFKREDLSLRRRLKTGSPWGRAHGQSLGTGSKKPNSSGLTMFSPFI